MTPARVSVPRVRLASRLLVRELGLLSRHPVVPCTPTEGHLLLELDRQGRLQLADLAEVLRLDKSTVCRAAGALRRRRLIGSGGARADRRYRWFRLTPAGQRLAGALNEHANSQVGAALALLGGDEREALLRGLEAYVRALRRVGRGEWRIRPAGPADDRPLARLLKAVRVELGAARAGYPLLDPEERRLSRYYARPRSRYLAAEAAGRILGGAGVAPLAGGPPDTCELQRMYLLPAARGRGLGASLLEACLDAARGFGYRRCYLETVEELEAAKRLYERYGFRRIAKPMGDTGHGHTTVWFLRPLGRSRR